MTIETVVELELDGRGQGWTDKSADVSYRGIEIDYGIQSSGIADHVASSGVAKFEFFNSNPVGKYSLNHSNCIAGFTLGIGVRIRLLIDTAQGTASGYLINNGGGYAEGTTTVTLDTGTGTIVINDTITFAGVSGEYVVTSTTGSPITSITFFPPLAGAVADSAAVTLVGHNFTRFRGRIDTVGPIAGIYGQRITQIEAVDWMDDAARAKVSEIPVQLSKRADEIFETLIESVPFEPDALEVDESPDTFAYALDSVQDEKSTVLAELQKLALSELGFIYQKADGTVVFESRNRRAVSEGVVDTFEDTGSMYGFSAPVARDDSLSRVQVITHPRKVDAAATSVLFRLDNPLEVGAHADVTILGPYRDPNQEAARVGGTAMVTPVAVTDYSANSQSDGAGTDLTSFITLTVNFGGNGAKVLVENNASTTAWLTLLQLRGKGIYDYQNVVLEAIDETAQINVGTTATANMAYQDNAALGEEIAIWLLAMYKDAETVAKSATIFCSAGDEALAFRVLSREISDRIDVVEQVTGFTSSPTSGHFIQSVNLTIGTGNNLFITWGLAPANRQQFWLLEIPGRSELDETTVLGFGLIVGHTDVTHSDTHDDGAHVDIPHYDEHTDTHTDVEHGDSAHTDSHADTVHTDTAHIDGHTDITHEDVSHRDSHSDVSHADSHSDTTHVDSHGDNPHTDIESHEDGEYEDAYQDVAHTDWHNDTTHVDSHADTAHSDSHNDRDHEDVPHTDDHNDTSHSDIDHGDLHGDAEHTDGAHGDDAHVDTHTDGLHSDTAHGDDHGDISHGDVN